MSIKVKMIVYFLVVVSITALGSAFTVWRINESVGLNSEIETSSLPKLIETSQVAYNAAQEVATLRGYLITNDPAMLAKYQQMAERNKVIEQGLIDDAATVKGRELATDVKMLESKYCEIADQKFIPLLQAGDRNAAIQIMLNELAPAAANLQNKVDEYVQYRTEQMNTAFATAMKEARSAKSAAVMAAVLAGVIGIAIGMFAAYSVSGPLVAATDHLNLMAKGDFTRDVPAAFLARKDEFGIMAKAFDNMSRNIRSLVHEVQTNVEHLASSSEELTASAEQSAQAANQVATSIGEVAKGAEGQLSAANNTSAIVEQISAGIQQVAASANQMASQSTQAADKAKAGTNVVGKAIHQMAQIDEVVSTSAQVVTKLGQGSKEIGQIVATITDIANQTNLLSLNAAIEAARAGEQGRGFAVVADEVRKLADQSGKAAKEIAALISEIQQDTDRAVKAMSDGAREVRMGTEVVNTAGEAFEEINELVVSVSTQMKEISIAIEQMAIGSQQIVTSVREIDELSKQSSAETQTVSAATEEQLASMEEIAAASQELSKLAQGLQDSVSKFRI